MGESIAPDIVFGPYSTFLIRMFRLYKCKIETPDSLQKLAETLFRKKKYGFEKLFNSFEQFAYCFEQKVVADKHNISGEAVKRLYKKDGEWFYEGDEPIAKYAERIEGLYK